MTAKDPTIGVMKVSVERGLYKKIDVARVSQGSHYTEADSWLTAPVRAFIEDRLQKHGISTLMDPFAGDGHILRAVSALHPALATKGFDLNVDKWTINDSLLRIPRLEGGLVCTNPPYLAKYSARRKGVLSLVQQYFDHFPYDDLYQLALHRMLEAGMPIVAIVPETYVSTGLFRANLERVVVLEKRNPFSTTETPVCVACFEPSQTFASPGYYKDDAYLGDLDTLEEAASLVPSNARRSRITFNVADGALALKAVDGTRADDRIRFMRGDAFDYDTRMIKVSSRLMTRIQVTGVPETHLDHLIAHCNKALEDMRQRSHDCVLSPFKGNNKAGTRRRRLDYQLARAIIVSAIESINVDEGDVGEQQPLF